MTTTTNDLLEAARAISASIVEDRRAIHMRPELAFTETQTAALVAKRLAELGIEAQTGVAQTGVVGLIKGSQPGKTVLLRADMDALPITEISDAPYTSQNAGLMHACGHDGHTSMLIGAARLLNQRRDVLKGNVKLMFQPAEEHGEKGGAMPMIEAGILEGVDAAFALHVTGQSYTGTIGLRAGPVMAATDRFTITIRGRGGHAARPHTVVDPIVVAAHVVTALQTLVSRETSPTEPAVCTIGSIQGGTAFNVVPDFATLKGTVRTYSPALRDQMQARMTALVQGICAGMRAEADVDYMQGYPALVNEAGSVDLVGRTAAEVIGPSAGIPHEQQMGGEDFAYLTQRVPGAMFYLGVRHPSWDVPKTTHTSSFDLDEAALPMGAAMLAGTAMRFLEER